MFKCGKCGKHTQPHQPVNEVVLEKRPMKYENLIVKGPDKGGWQTTEGFESVKVIRACPPCFGKLTGLEPKVAEVRTAPLPEKKERPEFKVKRDFNRPRKPVDKTNPNWKYKQELDEIRKREAKSADPRGDVQRKKPIVEIINKTPRV